MCVCVVCVGDFDSDDKLSAHEFVELDLSDRDFILHSLFLSGVLLVLALLFSRFVSDQLFLVFVKLLNSLPQFIVLFFESLDSIMHVSLGLVGNESLFQTVGN